MKFKKTRIISHDPCPTCGEAVPRKEGETPSSWKKRRCCSSACREKYSRRNLMVATADKYKILEAAHEPCPICRAPVLHHPGEPTVKYVARATCGAQRCAAKWHGKRERLSSNVPTNPFLEIAVVDYRNGFAAHNLNFKPSLGKLSKPIQHSYGVSAAWAVRD